MGNIKGRDKLGPTCGVENYAGMVNPCTAFNCTDRYQKWSGYPVSVSGMITVPVSASMFQTVIANLPQIHTQGDGTIQGEERMFQVVAPMVQVPKVEPSSGSESVDTITVTPQLMGTHQVVAMGNGEPQVLQVLSLKDAGSVPSPEEEEVKEEDRTTVGQQSADQ